MIHPQHFEQLIARMEEFMLLPTTLKQFLHPLLITLSLSAGSTLLRKNQLQDTLSFLLSGSCIELQNDPTTGKPEYKSFKKTNDFIFAQPGFFSQQPAQTQLILHQNSQLIQITREHYTQLAQNYPQIKTLSEMIRDHYHKQTQQRLYDLTHKTNKEKYQEFKYQHKDLLYSLCQYKLATYLGMSYPTFARLHNKP